MASAPLVDVTSPFWTFTSDMFLSLAFLFPAASFATYLVQAYVLTGGSSSAQSESVTPAELAARAGGMSADQRERDRAESDAVHADSLAKASAV